VDAEADRQAGQLRVLGEVVADHREAGGVAGVVVSQPTGPAVRAVPLVRVFVGGVPGPGAWGRGNVVRIHREACFFLGGQALALGLPSRRGPSYVCGCLR
jgi:hypothetical protein